MSSSIRASRQAYNAATALRRVFVSSSLPQSTIRALLPSVGTTATRTTFGSKASFSTSTRQLAAPKALPRDNDILRQYPVVHLVSENGRLSPPTNTASILHSIDPKTHSLISVVLPSRNLRSQWDPATNPSVDYNALTSHTLGAKSKFIPAAKQHGIPELEVDNQEVAGAYDPQREFADSAIQKVPSLPICKIVPVSHFLPSKFKPIEATKSAAGPPVKKKNKENPALTLKTIELNWAIDKHDLGHRLETMRGFLRKGFRVDVVLVGKRKKRKAEPEEAANTLRGVRECIESVEGAKEWKAMEGKVGGLVKMYIEGKAVEEEKPVKMVDEAGVSGPEAKEEKLVMKTATGKKLSKNRMKQLGLLPDQAPATA